MKAVDPRSALVMPSGALPALNGLRGLAAVGIALTHWSTRLGFSHIHSLNTLVRGLAERGNLGVEVFFVISGFLMWHNYSERLATPTVDGCARFMRARFARIYPSYFVATTTMLAAVLVVADRTSPLRPMTGAATVWANYMLVQAWVGLPSIVYPAWAVSALAGVYVVFPLMVPPLRRVASSGLLIAAMTALCATLVLFAPMLAPDLGQRLLRVIVGFTLGVLLASVAARATPHRVPTYSADVSAALLTGCLVIGSFSTWPADSVPAVLSAFGLLPLVAGIVYGCALSESPFTRLMSSRPFQALGAVSYPVILTHGVVIISLGSLIPPWAATSQRPLVLMMLFVIYVVLVAGSSVVLHVLVERPGRDLVLGRTRAAAGGRGSGGVAFETDSPGSD